MWIAHPIGGTWQPSALDAFLTAVGTRHDTGWITPNSLKGKNRFEVVWDADAGHWERIAQTSMIASQGSPNEVLGIPLRDGLAESFTLYRRTSKHTDKKLRADILTAAHAYIGNLTKLFNTGCISGAFCWNQYGFEQRALKALCKAYRRPCWHLEQGYFYQSLCFSAKGLYEDALDNLTWVLWRGSDENPLAPELLDSYKTKTIINNPMTDKELDEQLAKLNITKPILLVTGQLDADSNILYGSPVRTNLEMIQAAAKADWLDVVYKPHPLNDTIKHRDEVTKLGVRYLTGVPLPLILKRATAVATRNSTTGLEAILHEKPLVTLAKSIYAQRELSIDCAQLNEMPDAIRVATATPPYTETGSYRRTRLRFFSWMVSRHHYLVPGHHPEPLHTWAWTHVGTEVHGTVARLGRPLTPSELISKENARE